jgi:hypothetical protein
MSDETNFCLTENRGQEKPRRRGRPRKPGRSIFVGLRLREGEHDTIIARLKKLPKGRWSAYIRRVLDGAPVEALDDALAQESEELANALNGMWDDYWDEEEETE